MSYGKSNTGEYLFLSHNFVHQKLKTFLPPCPIEVQVRLQGRGLGGGCRDAQGCRVLLDKAAVRATWTGRAAGPGFGCTA